MKHFPHKHNSTHATHTPAPKSWAEKIKAAQGPKKTCWYHNVRWKMWIIILLTPMVLIGLSIAIIAHTAPLLDSLLDRYSENPADAKIALHYYYSYIASTIEDLPIIPGMKDAELEHLRDVRSLWRRGIIGLAGISFLLGILLWRAKKDGMLRPGLEYGSLLTVAMMIASQFVPFDDLWTWFHTLTFPQGNWMFEYNDKIVQLFTSEFFEAAVLRIALLALFLAMCVYGLAMVLKRLETRRNAADQAQKPQEIKVATVEKTVEPPSIKESSFQRQTTPSARPKRFSTDPSEPPEEVLALQKTAKQHLEEK